VTLGEEMARTVAQSGAPAERIETIPNWAPRELHTPASAEAIATCRERWGLADKFVVAYSGNLGRVHEFATILQSAALLRDRTGVIFLFIGQGARFDEVSAAARDRGLANVRLLPPEPRETVAASLAAADAHLVTLRPEYSSLVFPSKLAGALAASRPVLFVGPVTGEIGLLLERNECGAAVAPGDGSRLANQITRWQADPALRSRLGGNARTAYERHFTSAAALARWDERLHRLVPQQR
jgi:colanic acid biosynthesis glycosyl transferase WcaI